MKKVILICALALFTSGCVTIAGVSVVGTAAMGAYCNGLTEDARQQVRDSLTDGVQWICDK